MLLKTQEAIHSCRHLVSLCGEHPSKGVENPLDNLAVKHPQCPLCSLVATGIGTYIDPISRPSKENKGIGCIGMSRVPSRNSRNSQVVLPSPPFSSPEISSRLPAILWHVAFPEAEPQFGSVGICPLKCGVSVRMSCRSPRWLLT